MTPEPVRGGGTAAGWSMPFHYLPTDTQDPEPPYALADAWVPPHPLALPADLCDRIRVAALYSPLHQLSHDGTYIAVDLDPDDEQQVLERVEQANAAWWGLAVDEWVIGVKHYQAGEDCPTHQDLYGGAARRKLGGIVQLSDPGEYTGGGLHAQLGASLVDLPRAFGTLALWPSWTVHHVDPITTGERWVLVVGGYGPPLR